MTRDEYFRAYFVYDAETGVVTRSTSYKHPNGRPNARGYLYFSGIYPAMAHQIGWFLHHGTWCGSGLDHINRDKRDNRLANLRPASQRQNMGNVEAYANNACGSKGVYYSKETSRVKRWAAHITAGGSTKNLGRFLTKEEAVAAYNMAAQAVFGEFARLSSC